MARPTADGTNGGDQTAASAATLDIDPYSMEVLADPYPFHHELREARPMIWLEPVGAWATGRYEQVRQVLLDWQTFISGAGVGIHDLRLEGSWRPPSLLLEADPLDHTVVREIIGVRPFAVIGSARLAIDGTPVSLGAYLSGLWLPSRARSG